MNLAFITIDFLPDTGGIPTYCYEVAKRLHDLAEGNFVLIAPQMPGAAEFDRTCEFEVIRIKTNRKLLGPSFIPRTLPILRARKIDVVFHAQWQSMDVSAIAKKIGLIKYIACAVHGKEAIYNAYPTRPPLNRIFKKRRKYLINTADILFPVSGYTNNLLKDNLHTQSEKSHVIFNGTDPKRFYPKDTKALKKKYGYEGKLIITSIGRLIERKAVDTVLRAIPDVVKEVPNLLYLIVGEGPFRETLDQIVEELDIGQYIKFVGAIPYEVVNEYYNLADIFVMPSKLMLPEVESFGIVYLEANACGKPAIGSRTGGIADAIVDGETGLLVEERDPPMLAQAIVKLLKNEPLRNKMGQQGRKRVEQEANWEVSTQRMFDLIKQQLSS